IERDAIGRHRRFQSGSAGGVGPRLGRELLLRGALERRKVGGHRGTRPAETVEIDRALRFGSVLTLIAAHGFHPFTILLAINTPPPLIDTAKSWAILESVRTRLLGWA